MTEEGLGVASREDARPQPEAGVAANLLEKIRGHIWFNTGCSDDAAEQAAAAVYDLFLDQQDSAADLLGALKNARSYNPHPAGSAARREWRLGWLGAQRAESPGEAALDPAGLCVERSA